MRVASPVKTPLPKSVTVHIPLTIRQRGGRKLIVGPDEGADWDAPRARFDNTLIKALARAFRWKRMLDEGRYATISELAVGEKLDRGYLGKILGLTLLAPDLVEAILNGKQPPEIGVHILRRGFPIEWNAQRATIFGADRAFDPLRNLTA